MNIALHPELERFVQAKVENGEYSSPAEVLEAGLARLMLDPLSQSFDENAVAAIRESKAQIARGETVDFKEFAIEMRKKYLGR